MIPYSRQTISKDDIAAVAKALNAPFITQGPRVKEFEKALCAYTGAKYSVVVSSGTAALHIACLAAGIHEDDEVITSPLTFVASANCILFCGAKPVFADISEDNANIEPTEIEKKIDAKTRLLIPVHYAGHPCDMKEIKAVADRHKLSIIEDAAHALGADYRGAKVGGCRYSDMTIFSFHAIKSITTCEGGAVLTNDKSIYEKLLLYKNHGVTKNTALFRSEAAKSKEGWYYEMQALGYNYRLTDIQAVLGISQLKRLDEFIKERRRAAASYSKIFKGNPYFDIPTEKKYAGSSWHLYPIRLRRGYAGKKKKIYDELRERDIGVQVNYMPVYLHPYYRRLGYGKGLCPSAEAFYRSEMSIPIFPYMKEKMIKNISENVLSVLEKALS